MPPPISDTVSLQIPNGAEAGDMLTFVVGGSEMEIPVPEGSQPGDVLEIQVGGSTEGDGDDGCAGEEEEKEKNTCISQDGNRLTMRLPNDKTLQLSTTIPPNQVSGRKEEEEEKTDSSGGIDDGTYAHPWPAGIAMSRFWGTARGQELVGSLFATDDKNEKDNCTEKDEGRSNVLELGSGLGLVGLSFAAGFSSSVGKVVLSDVPGAMALLRQNMQSNRSVLDPTLVEAIPLLWTTQKQEQTAGDLQKYSLILASDVLYNTECIPALVSTVKRYLVTTNSSALLLGVRWRKPEIERSFFQALEGFRDKTWHLVHSLNCPLSWKAYGNPKEEASNRYFHQTMISVQGKPHSLAEIMGQGGEDASGDNPQLAETMKDEESEAFENCHIQIYSLHSMNEVESRKRNREES